MNQRTGTFLILFLFALGLWGCTSKKKQLVFVREISDGIYLAKYRAYGGGVYGGDIHEDYVSDSINFNSYVGSHFDSQNFLYYALGDTAIKVRKVVYDLNGVRGIDSFILNVNQLKKEKMWVIPETKNLEREP